MLVEKGGFFPCAVSTKSFWLPINRSLARKDVYSRCCTILSNSHFLSWTGSGQSLFNDIDGTVRGRSILLSLVSARARARPQGYSLLTCLYGRNNSRHGWISRKRSSKIFQSGIGSRKKVSDRGRHTRLSPNFAQSRFRQSMPARASGC